MSDTKDRRDFLKAAAVGVVGVATATSSALTREAAAEARAITINPNAKAVMPNGKMVDRRFILKQLGLDPNTPPDAWLAITSCGSNASALTDRARKDLMRRGILKPEMMHPRVMPRSPIER